MLSNDSHGHDLKTQVQCLHQHLQQAQAVPPEALATTLHFLVTLARGLQLSYVILEQQERWLPLKLSNGSSYLVGFAHESAAQVVATALGVGYRRLDTLPLLWRSLGQSAHLAFFETADAGTRILKQQPVQPITIGREQLRGGLRKALQQSRLA